MGSNITRVMVDYIRFFFLLFISNQNYIESISQFALIQYNVKRIIKK
jgi:hypothetical protein